MRRQFATVLVLVTAFAIVSGGISAQPAIAQQADTTAPVISPAPDMTHPVQSASDKARINFSGVSAMDDVDGSVAVTNDAPADGFPVGTTIITYTATDAAGNVGTATTVLTVIVGPPAIMSVRVGLNSIVFTGLTGTSAADFAATITGLVSMFRYEAGTQSWSSYAPALPSFANTLSRLARGDALLVESTAASTISQVDLLVGEGFSRITTLAKGSNFVAYTGASGDTLTVLGGVAGLQKAFRFEAATQTWLWYVPNAPSFVNTLKTLSRLDGLFLIVDGPTSWFQRAVAATPTPPPTPNHAPVITDATMSFEPEVGGWSFHFAITVTDADGDPLTCVWTVAENSWRVISGDCSGGIQHSDIEASRNRGDEQPTLIFVKVEVSDGKGGFASYTWEAKEFK